MDGPVRVGDTVRRPRGANTELVELVLHLLEAEQVPWAPRHLGFDDEGRETLSWIPGVAATSGEEVDLIVLARYVRELHDLTTELVDGFECVVHDDLQPRNVIVHDGVPAGLIDWEQARPGRRVDDVAKLCWSFVEPKPGGDPVAIARRWRDLSEVYGLDPTADLVSTVIAQLECCAQDIEHAAARGSLRHQVLARRGDHLSLRAMHQWTTAHESVFRAVTSR